MNVRRIKKLLRENGGISAKLTANAWKYSMHPAAFEHPDLNEYLVRCVNQKGIKIGPTLLLGYEEIPDYNYYSHPGKELAQQGFISIATTGRGDSKNVANDNVACVDYRTGRVYWANHKLFKHGSIHGSTPGQIIKTLILLADSLEEFLARLLQGELDERLKALETQSGKARDPQTLKTCEPEYSINWKLYGEIEPLVGKGRIGQAIKNAENKLGRIPQTPFHAVIGRGLLEMSRPLRDWLEALLAKGTKSKTITKAVYCEMNEFEINTGRWYLDGFGYPEYGGLKDTEWLSDYSYSSSRSLTLRGFEKLQRAFEQMCFESEKQDYEKAGSIAMILVTLRLMELFQDAFSEMKNGKSPLAQIPLLCSVHEWQLIYQCR